MLGGLVVALALIPEAISFSMVGFVNALAILIFMAQIPCLLGVPWLVYPNVPLTLETLQIIGPFALAMALVGLLESLMTAKLVDGITDTHSDKSRESWGQGVANVLSGLFGGMGGCAMIGQTMINVKVSGARTRISTFLAGAFLLALVLGAKRVEIVGLNQSSAVRHRQLSGRLGDAH